MPDRTTVARLLLLLAVVRSLPCPSGLVPNLTILSPPQLPALGSAAPSSYNTTLSASGALLKYSYGDCEGWCGGYNSADGCWCDHACIDIGDCCLVYESVCIVPDISSISPAEVVTAGTVDVTITGSLFGESGSVALFPSETAVTTSSWLSTEIIFSMPSGTGSGYRVRVTNNYRDSSSDPFNTAVSPPDVTIGYLAPQITDISPSSGLTSGDFDIVLTGTSFGGSVALASVTIDGSVDCPVSAASHIEITCRMPAGQGANLLVRVTVDGLESNSIGFSYDPPEITAVLPASAPTQGQTTLELQGLSLGTSGAYTTVDNQECVAISQTHDKILCTLPAGQGSSLEVRTTVADQSSNSEVFSYLPPTVSSITPASGPTSGGNQVVISGSSLGTSGIVTFGSDSCTSEVTSPCRITSHNHTHIVMTAPAGQGINVQVQVVISGEPSEELEYDYDAPVIDSVSPTTGVTQGGEELVVNGLNFGTSATVKVGGVRCPIISRTPDTQLRCRTPAGQGSNKNVVVTVFTLTSDPEPWSYSTPSVTSISPTSGSTSGGALLIVNGQNFGVSGTVSVGTFPCFPIAGQWSHTSVNCTRAEGEGRDARVRVTAGGLTSPSTAAAEFDHDAPNIDTVIPNNGPTSGSTAITLSGDNFGLTGTVTVGGLDCPISQHSHTDIVCASPIGIGKGLPIVLNLTGQETLTAGTSYDYDSPRVQSVAPSIGPTRGTTPLAISGSSFGASGGSVTVDGRACVVSSYSHSSIACALPAGEGLGNAVVVTNSLNDSSTVQGTFNYRGPTISSIAPASIATSGETITLFGSNFGIGSATVSVGGDPCLNPTVLNTDHTEMTCAAPAGSSSSVTVTTTVDGQTSSPSSLSYSRPSITDAYPAEHPTNGTTTLTIDGASFGVPPTTVGVTVDGQVCTVTSQTHLRLECDMPAGTGKSNSVRVTVGGQLASTTPSVAYMAPAISSVTPATSGTPGGEPLTLYGSNFGQSASDVRVRVGGVVATVLSATDDEVVASMPPGEGADLDVLVTVDGQEGLTGGIVSYDAPVIDMYVLEGGTASTAGGNRITINGTNFGVTAQVTIAGKECSNPVRTPHTEIICDLPSGQGRALDLTLSVGNQESTIDFDYDAPSVTSVEKATGNTNGNQVITVRGSSFGTSGSVAIGPSFVCPPVSGKWTHGAIECLLPEGQGRNLTISVTTGGQTSPETDVLFSYNAPNITGFEPASGPTSGGTLVTVTGTNFGIAGEGAVTVRIGAADCPVSFHAHTQLVCTLPPGQAGTTLDVVVASAYPDATRSGFSYSSPTIRTVAPDEGRTAGGSLLVITGTSFDQPRGSVDVGTVDCPIVSWGHSQVVCRLPAGQGTGKQVLLTTQANLTVVASVQIDYLAPVLNAVNPSNGATDGTTQLVLTGDNFGTSATVLVGGKSCVASQPQAHTNFTCTLPEGSGSNRPVVLQVDGRESETISFSYDAPYITGLEPASGSTLGNGYLLTITGTSFGDPGSLSGGANVTVGARPCPIHTHTHDNITCVTPSGEGSLVPVLITIDSQVSASSVLYNYLPPTITQVRPIVAGTAGGTTITLEGTNFGVGTGIVQIGGATCTVLTYDHTEVTCRLPAGEGRNKQVVISVSSRTATAVDRFHYKAPNVTAVTPNEGFTSGSDLIEIVGSDFGLNPLVTIGGLTCSPTTKSHTRIQCRTPRGQGRDLALVVTAASQTSAATPANFSYFAPTIALTPLEGPTQGKIRLTLRGTSFGQGGQISVNNVGCPIVPGSYSHVEVMCTLPAGQGVDLNVTLTVAGQVSNMQQFTYSDPEVLGLAPDPGPTAGSVLLTITGINFGTSGSVLVGGAPCTLGTGTVYRHTRIECVLPEGSGVSNDVVVSVARDSQPVNYRYSAPQLTSIEPLNGPTLGGTNVTLHGSNFGCVGSSTSQITVAWGTLTPSATLVSCTHSTIVFELPERVEISTSVAVTVDGQQSNALGTFSYDAPEITRVSGCNGDTATAAADCPIDGLVSEGVPVVLTVTGTNFGPSGTAALEIDGVACAAPTYGAAHAEVLCDLPQGVGSDIPVTVTVDGKSDTANLLSYAGPEFAAGSTNVTDALVAGGTSLQFDAKFVGSDSSRVAITYAPADGRFPDVVYNCTITGFVVVDADTRTVTCTMDAGVGQDLVLSITVDEDGFPPLVSAASYFTVSYAAPTLTADTLKSNSGPETNDLVGTESEGQIVLFRGTNFGDDEDLLSVRYGTEEDLNAGTGSSIKTCGDVQLQDGNTQIRCRTQPGDGGPFVFQVTALNQDSAVGSDTYSYPQVPIVYAVTGCSPHGSIANATADCDTEGDTEITIVGSKFGADSLSIKVGDGDCTDVQFIDSTELRCRTPEGAGLDQIVVVVVGVLFSEGHELLSYKVPVLESVTADSGTGCLADPDNAANLIECPREGGATLTITGTSLGPPSAIVIVGSSRCEDTVHSAGAHTEVTCTLPEGTGEDLDVFFVQANGESAAVTLTVSYAPCEAGEYADGAEGSTLCLQCEPGSFTAQRGEVECQQCEAGTFAAAAGAVECDRCARGNFSVRSGSGADVRGASECERCAAGSFAASAGQPACNTCPAGRYSGEGAHSCTRCAAGRFASSSGLSSCESCSPGSYSQEGALRCDPCAPGSFSDGTAPCQSCAVGRSQSASGQSSCDECPLGTATARTGQTRCLPCDSGSFANATELDVCFVCPAGSFSVKAVGAAQGATECTDCPTGRYIGVAGQGLCLQCNKGSFAITDGQTECEACEAGYFAETIGQDECEPCAIGRFANGEGSARCLQCEVGRATPSTASISCPLCDEGKYQPARGQSECIECGLDTVARARGQSNCRACPVGSYADALGSSSCTECVAGWFKSAGSPVGTCEQCAAGRFSSSAGQSECQACDVGRYGPSQQLTACEDCEVGKHTGSSGQTECLSCAEGTFAGGLGSLACKACPPGSVNTATGLSECSECDRGFYQPLSGESECQACEPGTYNPSKNQRQCLVCPVGRFSNESSATFCIECPLGTFQDSVGKTRCKECDPGKFASAEGQANCASCSLGKHQAQSRASSCDPCGPGTISTVLGSVDCTDCATGRFSSGSGQIQCKRCGVGTFNTGVRQSECTQCPIGTYQDQIGQTECRNCSAGEYAPGEGEIRCLPCPVGHFRTNTSTRGWECNECPTGKFQDVGGSTGCKSCPAGRFSASNASVSCEPCPSGQFNPNPTQTSCQRCPVGQYQPNAGSPDCELCPEGSATSSEGQARCVDCASGRYANDTGLDTCRTCPEGKYSAQRATDCLECPTGRYQPVIGQDACEPCEAGTYSDRTGMSTCIPCPAGFAQDSSAATECTPCVEGSVSSGLGSPVCQTCGVGKYQPQQNATACLDCDVGSVQPLTGQASCNPCPRGQYSPVSGQDKCLSCAIGSFGNVTGLDQCTLCRAGYYYPSSGGTACLACTQGTFTDAVGQGACIECPLGSYSNELAATECTPCPLGTFADSSAQTRCENCTAGRVAASEGTVNCRQCNIGRYVPNERQSECLPCASGSYQPNTGQTECLPCASGSYAPGQGETTCLLCPAGEFSSGSASRDSADACEQCEPGKFTNQAGRSECLSCAAGRFANNNASTVCTPCPPGTFAGEGAAECTPCARGSAQQSAGATSCKLCSAGSVVNSTGQQSCNICPKGRYAPGEGGTECFPCAPGNFTNIQGSSACKLCPAGSVAAAEAQEVRLLCSPGSFASDPGLQTCTACEEGKYSDRVGLDACIDCPAGQSAPGKGSKSCTACRLGRYAETAGQPSCDPCPIGTHQPNEGQPSCEPCLTGSFGLTTGASSCGICAPGTFSNDSGLQDCQDCPSGRYAPEAAMRECLPCPSGSFISSTGQVSCEPCPLGSAASEPGSPFCPPCRAGKFQNRLGQHNCTDCPAGKFSSSRGEVECRGCPVGSFSGTPGSVGCTLCPAGRFEVATNSTECDACPKGRFVSVQGSVVCHGCKVGTYAEVEALPTCRSCDEGTFQNETAKTECYDCPRGSFADNQGESACKECRPGSYGPDVKLDACPSCPPGRATDQFGRLECAECGPFEFAESPGQLRCEACPQGRFGNSSGQAECYECAPGRANVLFGQAACTDCTVGEFTDRPGQIVCQACAPGRASNETGQRSCPACELGRFQPLTNQTTCVACAAGRFAEAEGQIECEACQPGTFGADEGQSECEVCPIGWYSQEANATECVRCDVGQFSRQNGSRECDLCEPGRFANTTGTQECTVCEPGRFASAPGSESCVDCAAGRHASLSAAFFCDKCPAGRADSRTGVVDCAECASGKFQSVAGRQQCTDCTPGRYTSRTGRSVCRQCEVRTFAANPGQGTCELCPLGYAQNQTGQASCKPCKAGTVARQIGLEFCSACKPGFFTSTAARSVCTACAAGKYSATPGSTVCQDCARGRYAIAGSSSCLFCAQGTFAPDPGMPACTLCPTGKISTSTSAQSCVNCTKGRFAEISGQSVCRACQAGRFALGAGAANCVDCAPGLYAPLQGATGCQSCPLGQYAPQSGSQQCQQCPRGRFGNGSALTSCFPCEPGRFASVEASQECEDCPPGFAALGASAACRQCAVGQVAPSPRTTICTPCDSKSTSNDERNKCICKQGYYAVTGAATFALCRACPDGADCEQRGTVFETMTSETGWWRSNTDTLSFHRCLREIHCEGGRNSTCAAHRINPLCAICQDGYHSYFGGACVACPKRNLAWVFVVFVALAIVLVYIAMLWVIIRGGEDMLKQEIERIQRDAERDENMAGYGLGGWEEALHEREEQEAEERAVIRLNKRYQIQRPAEFMFKMKIMVGFLQVISNLAISLEIPWPTAFKRFVSFFSFANIDFLEASSVGCVADTSFYNKFVIMGVSPLVIGVLVAVFYLMPKYIVANRRIAGQTRVDMQRDLTTTEERVLRLERKKSRRNAWKMLIFTLFLIYPVVSSTVLRLYVCKRIDGVDYLLADFRKECFTDEWYQYAAIGALFIIVYPIGIPVFFFGMIWRYRRKGRLHEFGVLAQLGLLYDAYDSTIWWFEMLDMAHKLIVTSLLAFLPDDAQLPTGLFIVLGYAIAILLLKPYKRKGDDALHLLVQVELALMIYAGYMFYLDIDITDTTELTLAIVLIGLCVFIFLYFMSQFFRMLHRWYDEWKVKRAAYDGEGGESRAVFRGQDSHQAALELQRSNLRTRRKTVSAPVEGERVQMRLNPISRLSIANADPQGGSLVTLANNPAFAGGDGEVVQAIAKKRHSIMASPALEMDGEEEMETNELFMGGELLSDAGSDKDSAQL